jgi:hypothetical protein
MAAVARNAVLLLALVGIVVQLCSVVPPTAAAGRALVDVDQPAACVKGGVGGEVNGTFINGGGELNCTTTNIVRGAAYQHGEEQKFRLEAGNKTIIDNTKN